MQHKSLKETIMEIIDGIDPINYVIHPHQSMIVPYNVFCIANAI